MNARSLVRAQPPVPPSVRERTWGRVRRSDTDTLTPREETAEVNHV